MRNSRCMLSLVALLLSSAGRRAAAGGHAKALPVRARCFFCLLKLCRKDKLRQRSQTQHLNVHSGPFVRRRSAEVWRRHGCPFPCNPPPLTFELACHNQVNALRARIGCLSTTCSMGCGRGQGWRSLADPDGLQAIEGALAASRWIGCASWLSCSPSVPLASQLLRTANAAVFCCGAAGKRPQPFTAKALLNTAAQAIARPFA